MMAVMMGDSVAMGSPPAHQSSPETSLDTNSNNNNNSNNSDEQSGQSSEPLVIEWDPPAKNPSLVQYYRIFWRPIGSRQLSRTVTNLTWIKLNDLNMHKQYEFVIKAANQHGSSVYSEPLLVKPEEIFNNRQLASVGMIWFMPSSGHLIGRVLWAVCFATAFMFSSLAIVMLLERKGYLKRFASSKSNNSRVSFANPAYVKDSDGNQDSDNVNWDSGHSLDLIGLPPVTTTNSTSETQTAPDTR